MHPLIDMLHLTRREFLRGIEGLSDDDARVRSGPMNSIGWTIGHMAWQEHIFFVAWPRGEDAAPEFAPYSTDALASQPALADVLALYRRSSEEADEFLSGLGERDLGQPIVAPDPEIEAENLGTRIVRNIFHTWSHVGEVSAIRQTLGHPSPPEFVDLHGWQYEVTATDRQERDDA